jgi:predicted aspartyl protease
MCPEIPINQVKAGEDEPQKVEGKQNAAFSNYCCAEEVLLQTLLVYLETSGQRRKVRALIDTGLQRSYILKKTAKEMGYTPVGSASLIHTLFGGAAS